MCLINKLFVVTSSIGWESVTRAGICPLNCVASRENLF